MKLINLTPHTIKLSTGEDIRPTGYVSRVNTTQVQVDLIRGIPVLVSNISTAVNLPEKEEGTCYIVPSVVRLMAPDRKDLLSPTRLIRDSNGAVVGCGAFERNI